MESFRVYYEEFKVRGKDLVEKLREALHEGNVRRIIVRDGKGNTFMEIPLTVATIGAVAAPLLAAVGTLAALVADFTIVIERTEPPAPPSPPEQHA